MLLRYMPPSTVLEVPARSSMHSCPRGWLTPPLRAYQFSAKIIYSRSRRRLTPHLRAYQFSSVAARIYVLWGNSPMKFGNVGCFFFCCFFCFFKLWGVCKDQYSYRWIWLHDWRPVFLQIWATKRKLARFARPGCNTDLVNNNWPHYVNRCKNRRPPQR